VISLSPANRQSWVELFESSLNQSQRHVRNDRQPAARAGLRRRALPSGGRVSRGGVGGALPGSSGVRWSPHRTASTWIRARPRSPAGAGYVPLLRHSFEAYKTLERESKQARADRRVPALVCVRA
jgi:hypothetical protein